MSKNKRAGMTSKYSRDVMIDILSDVGEFTPLRKEFKLDEDLEVIGTGEWMYDSEGQGYREIIPEVPIQSLGFSYGESWQKEDVLLISILFQDWSEDQWSMKNVSSMSPVKLAKKIAKMILKKAGKVDFERDWDAMDGDDDVPHLYTDEGPSRRYANYGHTKMTPKQASRALDRLHAKTGRKASRKMTRKQASQKLDRLHSKLTNRKSTTRRRR